MDGFDFSQKIIYLIPNYLVLLLSIVCHEAAHAWSASKLGDSTAEEFVSFNPLPHIRRSPFGMLLIPLLLFATTGFMFGYASVPVNIFWARNHPRKYGLSSLAGPAANFILAFLALLSIFVLMLVFGEAVFFTGEITTVAQGVFLIAQIVLTLNIILGTFNLIPVPPLDGSHVPLIFIPRDSQESYMRIIWNPSMALPGMLIAYLAFPSIMANAVMPMMYFGLSVVVSITGS